MPSVERVRVAGLRSLCDVDLRLMPVTILIGPNGAGKSNLALTFDLLSHVQSRSLQLFVSRKNGASALLYRGAKTTPELSLELELSDREGRLDYRLVLTATEGDRLWIREEAVRDVTTAIGPWLNITEHSKETELVNVRKQHALAERANAIIRSLKRLHVHDTSPNSALRSAAKANDDRYLRTDASNLAAFLLGLQNAPDPAPRAASRRILHLVQRVAPFIKELTPRRLGDGVTLDWTDDADDVWGVAALSDGTLRAIALIAMLAQPSDQLPKLLVIDEPELGLHPVALSLVMDLCRSAASACQIILATQSTGVLDLADPAEVVIVERADARTRVSTLDAAQIAAWRREFAPEPDDGASLSELAAMNLLGGRP